MEKLKRLKNKIPWSIIFNIFIVCLTIGLIVFFIFSKDGFIDLVTSGLSINWLWLALAVLMHLLNLTIDASIIYMFLKKTTPNMTVKKAVVTSMVGQFYCAVTPSSTGGQPMQLLYMTRMGIKGANGISALIQKFLVWQVTLTTCSIISMALRFSMFAEKLDVPMWILTVVGFIGQMLTIAALLLASFSPKFTAKVAGLFYKLLAKIHLIKDYNEKMTKLEGTLKNFHDSNKALNKNKGLLIKVYVMTFIQMMCLFLVPFCISMAFNKRCNMFDMLCAQSYVTMVSSLVPLPGASGAAEYCFSTFFSAFFDEVTMKSAILLWRTITYYGTIIISLPFSGVKKRKTAVDNYVAEQGDI